MKCPKCGYTSFETSDSCRRCSNDLSAFRQAHGLTPIVLPAALRTSMAKQLGGTAAEDHQTHETGGSGDMFTFDLPQHKEPAEPAAAADPFAFVNQPAGVGTGSLSTPTATPNDPFAELLETTPTVEKPVAPTAQESGGQGFELNSFSWDETPEPAAAGAAPQAVAPKKTDDDFSSLFGDLGTPEQKP